MANVCARSCPYFECQFAYPTVNMECSSLYF